MLKSIEGLSGAAIVASLLFGGATAHGFASDAIPQLVSLPLLVLIALQLPTLVPQYKWSLFLLAGALALPLVQLVPLPPEVWSVLPGRLTVLSTYSVAGMNAPWHPISMSPDSTISSALTLIPPAAIFLGVLCSNVEAQRRLASLIAAIGLASVFLDIAQMVGGASSPLRFYEFASTDRAVGFFVNPNHNAALLYCLVPLVTAAFWPMRPRVSLPSALTLLLLYLVLILGLAMTRSRSSILLGGVSGVLTLVFVLRPRVGLILERRAILLGAGLFLVVALPLAALFGFTETAARLQNESLLEQVRLQLDRTTGAAAVALFPFGSGLGSFERVYPLFEDAKAIFSATANHAHNDVFELFLEGGLPALVLIAGWLVWLMFMSFRCAKNASVSSFTGALPVAACIVCWLLILHSLWDYPLRTEALGAVLAFSCAILCRSRTKIEIVRA